MKKKKKGVQGAGKISRKLIRKGRRGKGTCKKTEK